MAWKHGPKPAEKLWLHRKEMEYETQLNAYASGLKLIVVGGENYPHRLVVETILDRVHRQRGIKELLLTDANRVSYWAQRWASHERTEATVFARDVLKDGSNAEFCRNIHMLKTKLDGLIAFPGDGTGMLISQASRAGVRIWKPLRD